MYLIVCEVIEGLLVVSRVGGEVQVVLDESLSLVTSALELSHLRVSRVVPID
jgi:hypothetical protein